MPKKGEKIAPLSLPLAYPPSIVDMLAGLGPTHEAIAERVGLSRPQVTNVIVRSFRYQSPCRPPRPGAGAGSLKWSADRR